MAGPLIVTAEPGAEDLAWLDHLRQSHYPSGRNRVPAHLTMFHALPPSSEGEVRYRLARLAEGKPPQAWLEGLMDLGGGVAFRIVSPELDAMRQELASAFHGMLTPQDSAGWRPHVTIQNKVAPKVARELLEALQRNFRSRPLTIRGLAVHRYLGGPWEPVASYSFRGA